MQIIVRRQQRPKIAEGSQRTGKYRRRVRSTGDNLREDRQHGGSEGIRYRKDSQHALLRERNTNTVRRKLGGRREGAEVAGGSTEKRSHRRHHG